MVTRILRVPIPAVPPLLTQLLTQLLKVDKLFHQSAASAGTLFMAAGTKLLGHG